MILLTYNNLSEHSEKIAHFSSTRNGGVSTQQFASLNLGVYTQDTSGNIHQNRVLLANELGINSSQIYNAHQVHGVAVKSIDEAFIALHPEEQKVALEGFDALITNLPGACITVTTADCVPILLYDNQNNAVAAIHSGWRSTLDNITVVTIQSMQQHFGTKAKNLIVAIGPCISKPAYEVGIDVFSAFEEKGFDVASLFETIENDKFLFDIRKAVQMQLFEAGVLSIEHSPYCTFRDEDLFFSARRQGLDSGRMLSGILLKP